MLKSLKRLYKFLSLLTLVLLTITGHLGGTLTHGENFLFANLNDSEMESLASIDLQQAHLYADLVRPILQNKCYTCHGTSKQKGKLRLDLPEHIAKGGKSGVVLVAGQVDESEMIDRLLLPMNDDDHMPPKEKKQLSTQEIEILKTWINSGADFERTVVAVRE
ncbi:MAG: c-type cytochrome domain-containing protein [Cytophagales bacterium]|nr:c-type cytochrome domain-containing protein [Cytophagales bacterium]